MGLPSTSTDASEGSRCTREPGGERLQHEAQRRAAVPARPRGSARRARSRPGHPHHVPPGRSRARRPAPGRPPCRRRRHAPGRDPSRCASRQPRAKGRARGGGGRLRTEVHAAWRRRAERAGQGQHCPCAPLRALPRVAAARAHGDRCVSRAPSSAGGPGGGATSGAVAAVAGAAYSVSGLELGVDVLAAPARWRARRHRESGPPDSCPARAGRSSRRSAEGRSPTAAAEARPR